VRFFLLSDTVGNGFQYLYASESLLGMVLCIFMHLGMFFRFFMHPGHCWA
ncbi:MAG: hypothetical protein K0R39_2456, partial [Symbiobacteriaceae bacterium]|nr:hypothetical protein [Symbiobacteriaceae bacterium]